MKMEKLYIVIPAYNEQGNIKELISDWYPVVESIGDAQLLIINDGSRDNTYEILVGMKKDRPKLNVVSKVNGGHGDTLLYGYQYAANQHADWIFQTDSDGQTRADEFWRFWEEREKYDAIFGNRVERGDGRCRKFVEKILCILIKLVFGISIPDANCPFRLMKAKYVQKYIDKLPEHYFLPNVMLTVFFVKNNSAKFERITFESRKGGPGNINAEMIIKVGLKSIGDFIRFRKEI